MLRASLLLQTKTMIKLIKEKHNGKHQRNVDRESESIVQRQDDAKR
jgi:hypothetical protein